VTHAVENRRARDARRILLWIRGLRLRLLQALQLLVDLLRGLDTVGGRRTGTLGRLAGLACRVGDAGDRGSWGRRSDIGGTWRLLLDVHRFRLIDGIVVPVASVGVGWRGTTALRGEDELGWDVGGGVAQEHIAASSIDQAGQNLGGRGRAILAEDTFVGNASGDLHPSLAADIAENLIEAGVVGGDFELAVGENNLCVTWGRL
jgi:hypothetical protein